MLMQIDKHTIHIWNIDLADTLGPLENLYYPELSADEQSRANRFHFQHHRSRYIIARAFLRRILGLYLSISPADIVFNYTEHAKPFLFNPSSTISFNLSHSGNKGLIAIGLDQMLGVDIEQIEMKDHTALAKRFFSEQEVTTLTQLPLSQQAVGFYRIWTRKEAILKAVGAGLSLPLSTFSVSWLPNLETLWLEGQTWRLLTLPLLKHYETALATNQEIHSIEQWNFDGQSPNWLKRIPIDAL